VEEWTAPHSWFADDGKVKATVSAKATDDGEYEPKYASDA